MYVIDVINQGGHQMTIDESKFGTWVANGYDVVPGSRRPEGEPFNPSPPSTEVPVTTGEVNPGGVVYSPDGTETKGQPRFDPAAGEGFNAEGWTESMVEAFNAYKEYIQGLVNQGLRVNPNVEIDEAKLQEFREQARKEFTTGAKGTYYNQLFDQADKDLETAINRQKEDFGLLAEDRRRKFGFDLEMAQENFARRGLAFSSDRYRTEQELADQTSRDLRDLQKQTNRNIFDIGQRAERYQGSANVNQDFGFNIGRTPILNVAGVYDTTDPNVRNTPFTKAGRTAGTLEQDKLFDQESRVKEIIQAEREHRGSYYR